MSNIVYNEKEEAFELPYKLWDSVMTVRFYTESEEDIMGNISDIAMKLETLGGSRKKIASLIAGEGYYEGSEESLSESLTLDSVYVDMDEDDIIVCFTVSSSDGYMKPQSIELIDGEFEIVQNLY